MDVTPDVGTANQLYWESDASVAEIAARFDLSRRALYDAIEPLPAEAACAVCGGGLVWENRLARRTGQSLCSSCGERQALAAGPRRTGLRPDVRHGGRDGRDDQRGATMYEDDHTADLRHRAVLLGGAAIAGLAIGTVAALWARRHD